MQNVAQGSGADNNPKIEKVVNVQQQQHDVGNSHSSSTPHSHSTSNSSPAKSETETYSEHRQYISDTSESEEDSVSEVESFVIDESDNTLEAAKFLINAQQNRTVDPITQARIEQLLQAAGIGQLATKDGKHLADPEVLRRLTSSVSSALDEAAAALTRMRSDTTAGNQQPQPEKTSLVEACTDGDVCTVKKLLTEGRSVHETSEEGESLLSLACSAGYYELAQVLLAMNANVEDRGIKGECTPLMEAASAGHLDIVRLLVRHGAEVNAQSTTGNTPLMYGCAGGHQDVVKFLLEKGANVEDHNENGHTPLMEAASAGHVGLAKILLMHGAGINTHSNEFKESALTLACYKGHLDMVKFLLEAGADQEHKTDEMHTALMEASMDGHVEVARLLLDSGAQVNMPTDSFESPLTLAACGGHVDLAMLLIERGANIEEVNDEGYTPLMEAAREGHEDMVALLLNQGAHINAQTDETQETALTLACCGGFTEVADYLYQAGADIELGASTPLMEAAQEGHLKLVEYLLEKNANVHAQTQTGDTALTYACENGHTDVVDKLLQYGADLEHESEGGRTPLMKACRAGHQCAVQFLISKGANVHRQTTNNDHTPLSLACAGGHLNVVELLLANGADPNHKLKDNSTMLIEAAKGGHTTVVQLLLDYPHSMLMNQPSATAATMLPGHVSPLPNAHPTQRMNFLQSAPDFSPAVLQEVPEAVRIVPVEEGVFSAQLSTSPGRQVDAAACKDLNKGSARTSGVNVIFDATLTTAEAQQVRTQPLTFTEFEDADMYAATTATMEFLAKQGHTSGLIDKKKSILDYVKNRKKLPIQIPPALADEGTQKQQILEELHRVDREFGGKQQQQQQQQQQPPPPPAPIFSPLAVPQDDNQSVANNAPLPHRSIIDIDIQDDGMGGKRSVFPVQDLNAFYAGVQAADLIYQTAQNQQPPFCFGPITTMSPTTLSRAPTPPLAQTPLGLSTHPIKIQTLASHTEVSQNTAISDRPKAKAVSKKEGKNVRKVYTFQHGLPPPQVPMPACLLPEATTSAPPVAAPTATTPTATTTAAGGSGAPAPPAADAAAANKPLYSLDLDTLGNISAAVAAVEEAPDAKLTTANFLQDLHNHPLIRAALVSSPSAASTSTAPPTVAAGGQQPNKKTNLDYVFKSATKLMEKRTKELADNIIEDLQCYNLSADHAQSAQSPVTTQFPESLDESMLASLDTQQHDLANDDHDGDVSRVEYFAVPNHGVDLAGVQHTFDPYEQYLQAVGNNATGAMPSALNRKGSFCRGFQANISLMQHTLGTGTEAMTSTVPINLGAEATVPSCVDVSTCVPPTCTHIGPATIVQTNHYCQVSCTPPPPNQTQVQTGTQTQVPVAEVVKKPTKTAATAVDNNTKKKDRYLYRNVQKKRLIDPNNVIGSQYGDTVAVHCPTTDQATFCMDVDSETESNHDTALTLACAGGHEELVELLIQHGADIEHRDKKGFTPLILAATAGHEKVVELLLKHNADIEAQSERTKDTPLSLACSGGRYEVVEILLNRNANKEHRNVSDYTPLSLAASGGYVNIIKLLLQHGAEINSRTGSKLGISPLMLAAMNGHTAAVKLLLDMGSDINAQIETNRNTALTLACFQGRHEVVSLLLDRKANVEHRAKTGLTPLMEAASGGYVDVGRVLLDKGADVNATPVPSSRDTALTIAADKGHVRFVDLLLNRGAAVEVKNKKGNSPLWLAANGGHLNVVELLHGLGADIDSQDNRKVSCLMAAYRKGHVKVVKWMVNHVTQFPSDQEMIRYMTTVSEKENELLDKCHECIKIIRAAKETQAAKANKNASILLEELDMEKNREESKKAAAARKRERKKKKKLEKKEEKRKLFEENKKNEYYEDKNEDDDKEEEKEPMVVVEHSADKEEGDSGIDANSQGSCSSNDVKSKEKRKDKKKKKPNTLGSSAGLASAAPAATIAPANTTTSTSLVKEKLTIPNMKPIDKPESKKEKQKTKNELRKEKLQAQQLQAQQQQQVHEHVCTKSPADRDEFEPSGSDIFTTPRKKEPEIKSSPSSTSPKQSGKREEGWKEVVRKSSVQPAQSDSGVKKVSVPLNAISRVIGRGGSNINAIRGATGAHIEVEKQSKGQGERIITIKGSADATKQAHTLIAVLIRDPDADILQMLPKTKAPPVATTLWDKTQIGTKKVVGKTLILSQSSASTSVVVSKPITTMAQAAVRTNTVAAKPRLPTTASTPRVATAPRLLPQNEKDKVASVRAPAPSAAVRLPSAAVGKVGHNTSTGSTFAAKLSDVATASLAPVPPVATSQMPPKPRLNPPVAAPTPSPVSPNAPHHNQQASTQSSPKHTSSRPAPTSSAPPNMQHVPQLPTAKAFSHAHVITTSESQVVSQPCSPTPPNHPPPVAMSNKPEENNVQMTTATSTTQSVYTLFNDIEKRPMWRHDPDAQKPQNFAAVTGGGNAAIGGQMQNVKYVEQPTPITIDASKAPGYRGNAMCSPVSSKTSSNSTTPPNSSYHYDKPPPIAPIGSHIPHNRPPSQNHNDPPASHYYERAHMAHAADAAANMYKQMPPSYGDAGLGASFQSFPSPIGAPHLFAPGGGQDSRLNPKAPDFHGKQAQQQQQQQQQQSHSMYNGYGNMFAPSLNKPNIFHQPSNPNAWTMQFNPGNEHHHLINGMAGMTLQHLARATDAIYDAGDLSPTLSPKPLLQFGGEMQPPHVGVAEEQRKPPQAPIGMERSRKLNPADNNGWLKERANSMQHMWHQGARIPNPVENRDMNFIQQRNNLPCYPDFYPDSHSAMLMESNINMSYLSQQQPLPMASNHGLSMEYQPEYKMTPWDSRSNTVDMQDKQQLGWSGGANDKWNS